MGRMPRASPRLLAASPPVTPANSQAGCEIAQNNVTAEFYAVFPLPGECLPIAFTMSNKKPFFPPLDIFISPLKDVQ
jgi:hypothetical protein